MKPMLASPADIDKIEYPVYASPKLDGVRCLIVDGVARSRSFKQFPNPNVNLWFSQMALSGFDGELIVGKPTDHDVFSRTTSYVMSHNTSLKYKLHLYVFDYFGRLISDLARPFERRLSMAKDLCQNSTMTTFLDHKMLFDRDDLEDYEEKVVAQGYEGIMIRRPLGHYKTGRSTTKEGLLLKLKRFEDDEALVLDANPLMHNTNAAETNELGYKERSSKKSGMVSDKKLGSLLVRSQKTGIMFEIGTGFTDEQRIQMWKDKPIGKIIKYKYQPVGVKDKPRFPVFMGFRDARDM